MKASIAQGKSRWVFTRLRRITTASHRYMAEVDGLRFVAILSVVLFHVYYNVAHARNVVLASSPYDFVAYPVTHGFRGVQLFFVISGFILGLPFAAHYLSNGPEVKLGRFYLRRLTRLEPPYILAMLLIYAAAVVMHNVHTDEADFYSSLWLRLFYVYLFVHGVPPTLNGVTWSLEIEVQFYLLAPLLAHVFKQATMPRRLTLIVAICAAPVLAHMIPFGERTLLGSVQYFLMGFLLADLHCTGAGAGRWPTRVLDGLGIGCLLAMLLAPETPVVLTLLPWLLGGIFIGAVRGGWLTSILRRPTISVIGGMCYSLYLLHNPILSFVTTKVVTQGMTLPQAYLRLAVAGIPFALAMGTAYYILIERPCMVPNWPRLACQYISCRFNGRSETLGPPSDSNRRQDGSAGHVR